MCKFSMALLFLLLSVPKRWWWFFFFFQAEDGIRDIGVTGVQTCALPILLATLEKDHIAGQDEALLDIYRKLRPGEPPTRESAQALLENLFFNPKRYDLAKVGRYKVNKKLGVAVPQSTSTLTEDDIVATIEYVVRLHAGEPEHGVDDIDHFGNRRLRTVGELIQNQIRVGLSRMERVVRERMTTQDVEAITPQTLINIRPVVASIKEFFGTSQLSQFMD